MYLSRNVSDIWSTLKVEDDRLSATDEEKGLVIGSSLTLCEQRIDKNQEKLFLTASYNLKKILCQSISEFQHLKVVEKEEETFEYFGLLSRRLKPFYVEAMNFHHRKINSSFKTYERQPSTSSDPCNNGKEPSRRHLTWMSEGTVFVECLKNLGEATNSQDLVGNLCVATSIFERSLGDLLHSQNPALKIPHLLREVSTHPLIRDLLGFELSLLLKLLFGSPKGLNVRNILWHGFIANDSEIPAALPAILWSAAVLIGLKLSSFEVRKRKRRPLPKVGEIYANVCDNDGGSKFEAETTRCNGVPIFRAYRSICHGFQALERELRFKFAEVNRCSSRVKTAEMEEFYLTFNELLDPNANESSNDEQSHDLTANKVGDEKKESNVGSNQITTKNLLIEFIDRGLMEFLQDVLFMPEGPRLRDRISHGEYRLTFDDGEDLSTLAEECKKWSDLIFRGRRHFRGLAVSTENGPNLWFHNYESKFHPNRKFIQELTECLGSFRNALKYASDFVRRNEEENSGHENSTGDDSSESFLLKIDSLYEEVQSGRIIKVLFRPKDEVQLVKTFRRIVSLVANCISFSVQQLESNSFSGRTLASAKKLCHLWLLRSRDAVSGCFAKVFWSELIAVWTFFGELQNGEGKTTVEQMEEKADTFRKISIRMEKLKGMLLKRKFEEIEHELYPE